MNTLHFGRLLWSVAGLCGFLTSPLVYGEDAVTLRINWMPGKTYTYENVTRMVQDITVPTMPAPMKQEMDQVQEFTMAVSEVEADGSKKLAMQILAMKQEIKMGPQTMMKYDSKAPAEDNASNPLGAVLGKLVGAKMAVTLDAEGKVRTVEGLNELLTSIDPEKKTPFPVFTEDSVKQMMGHAQAQLPDKPVKPGDKWTSNNTTAIPGIGNVEITMDSTFEKWVERRGYRCAVLKFTGAMSISSGPDGNAANIKIETRDGKVSGTTWFAAELGTVVDTNMNQDAQFDMEIAAPGAEEPMKLASKMTMKVTTALKALEDAK